MSKFLSISLILGVLHGVRPQHSALEVGPYQDWPSLKTAAKNWKTQDGGKRRIHIDLLKSLGQMHCQIFMKHALFCILIKYITYILYIYIYVYIQNLSRVTNCGLSPWLMLFSLHLLRTRLTYFWRQLDDHPLRGVLLPICKCLVVLSPNKPSIPARFLGKPDTNWPATCLFVHHLPALLVDIVKDDLYNR